MENKQKIEWESEKIEVGQFIIVQRQGYTKLHKLKQHGDLVLGNFTVEMDNVIGERYYDTFQMKNLANSKKMFLEKVEEPSSNVQVKIEKTGLDNRHINSEGQSQTLTKEEIDKLKEEEFSANNIVEQLISNSKTFNLKTEYSQEKYIKKKEKKYFEYIQIRRPSIRLLAQMFYRQDASKTLGIRMDDLSQILTYANLHSEGNHLLYDSGTSGLMAAALTNAMGPNTPGTVIHLHPGNECQKSAFLAMQFPQEQADRCINVNLYSVLRNFYQTPLEETGEPATKKTKLEESNKKLNWQMENERACKILHDKVDSIVITAKEHPVNLVKELLQFLKGGRNFVVFNLLREPLQDLFVYLKGCPNIIAIKLSNNFMRNYQVLPDRTHPEVNMTTGGYILSAHKLVD